MADWKQYIHTQNYIWKLCDLSEKNEFHIETHDSSNYTTALHSHEYIQIYYVHYGVIRHTICYENERMDTLTKGDIFIIPPGVFHKVDMFESDTIYTSLSISSRFINYDYKFDSSFSAFINFILMDNVFDSNLTLRNKLSLNREIEIKVEEILHSISGEYSKKNSGYETYINGEVLKLLVIIAREYSNDPFYFGESTLMACHYESVLKSVEYINDNFTQNLKIDDICKKFLLSRTYFCKLFKIATNTTFNYYINNLRVNHAKTLLRTTNFTIAEVAYMSGFNDISTFYREFKKIFGVSPLKMKKN